MKGGSIEPPNILARYFIQRAINSFNEGGLY